MVVVPLDHASATTRRGGPSPARVATLVGAVIALAAGVPAAAGAASSPAATSAPAAAGAAPSPAAASPAAATTDAVPAPTVELLRDLTVFAAPEVGARRAGAVAARRPITHGRTVLPVLQAQTDAVGHRWVRVLLPGRPNGRSGWIRTRSTRAAVTPWSVDIDRAARSGVVRRLGVVVRRFRVIVGAPSTPTPVGRFFVEESIRLPGGRVAGPFALALSSRSEVLQEFAGGPGQIALHGRDGLGGTLGTAVSHGCMRLGRADVAWLAARVGPGARVTVRSRGTGPTTRTAAAATRGASPDDRTTPGTPATDTSSTTTGPGR